MCDLNLCFKSMPESEVYFLSGKLHVLTVNGGIASLVPPASLCKRQRTEDGEEGAQPRYWSLGLEPDGAWRGSGNLHREVGRGRERNYLSFRLGLVDPLHVGRNIGNNKNYLPCHKVGQLCSCITHGVDVSSLGLVFSVQVVLQCHSNPGVPRHRAVGAAREAWAEQLALQKQCAGSKYCVRPLSSTWCAHEQGHPMANCQLFHVGCLSHKSISVIPIKMLWGMVCVHFNGIWKGGERLYNLSWESQSLCNTARGLWISLGGGGRHQPCCAIS